MTNRIPVVVLAIFIQSVCGHTLRGSNQGKFTLGARKCEITQAFGHPEKYYVPKVKRYYPDRKSASVQNEGARILEAYDRTSPRNTYEVWVEYKANPPGSIQCERERLSEVIIHPKTSLSLAALGEDLSELNQFCEGGCRVLAIPGRRLFANTSREKFLLPRLVLYSDQLTSDHRETIKALGQNPDAGEGSYLGVSVQIDVKQESHPLEKSLWFEQPVRNLVFSLLAPWVELQEPGATELGSWSSSASATTDLSRQTTHGSLATLDGSDSGFVPDFKHPYEITIHYDKFKDFTLVMLHKMKVAEQESKHFMLEVGASYMCPRNTTRCRPEFVDLYFRASGSRSFWFSDSTRTVTFLIDGRQIEAEPADWDGSVDRAFSSVLLAEEMYSELPTKDFLQILEGKRVEGQLGSVAFVLSEENLEALRDLASRMGPPPQAGRGGRSRQH